MNWYTILLVIHVITAVGGLGQLSVFGLMTRMEEASNTVAMRRILKAAGISLIIMLLTGIGMLWLTNWHYEQFWWFRISFVLYLALGALHGIAQSTLRKATANGAILTGQPRGKLTTIAIAMNVILAALVYLMEAKPF
jgi:hypothetical protein